MLAGMKASRNMQHLGSQEAATPTQIQSHIYLNASHDIVQVGSDMADDADVHSDARVFHYDHQHSPAESDLNDDAQEQEYLQDRMPLLTASLTVSGSPLGEHQARRRRSSSPTNTHKFICHHSSSSSAAAAANTSPASSRSSHSFVSLCSDFTLQLTRWICHLPPTALILLVISITLCVDHFIRPPHGFLPLRVLTGTPVHQTPPVPCGWDYEANWKIGTLMGNSPLTLKFTTRKHSEYTDKDRDDKDINDRGDDYGGVDPVITCAQIDQGISASFVADPFLIIIQKPFMDTFSIKQLVQSQRLQSSSSSSSSSPSSLSNKQTPLLPIEVPLDPLLLPQGMTHQKHSLFFVFYELKNLESYKGEIGVSVSQDGGRTFTFLGIALSEVGHLSYPVPFYDAQSHRYILIPEASYSSSIRVYTTTPQLFPFGWQLHSTPLTGHRFADTSPIFYHSMWCIFTTYDTSLHLYLASSLLIETGTGNSAPNAMMGWQAHPLSPVVQKNRVIGRSGGRPIIVDGQLIRIAQDDSIFYGSRLLMIHVDVLTMTEYKEHIVRVLEPAPTTWASIRLHHMDAHRIDAHTWLAFIDGDDTQDDHEFYQREGWFKTVKTLSIAICFLLAIYIINVRHRSDHQWQSASAPLPLSVAFGHSTGTSYERNTSHLCHLQHFGSQFSSSLESFLSWSLSVSYSASSSSSSLSGTRSNRLPYSQRKPPSAVVAVLAHCMKWLSVLISTCTSISVQTMWGFMLSALCVLLAVVVFLAPYYPTSSDGYSGFAQTCLTNDRLFQVENLLTIPMPADINARIQLKEPHAFAINLVTDTFTTSPHTDTELSFLLNLSFPHSSASFTPDAATDADFKVAMSDMTHSRTIPSDELGVSVHAISPYPLISLEPILPVSSFDSSEFFIPLPELLIVSAVSAASFDRVQNLVGSIHFWEPTQPLLIFDVGLTHKQRAIIQCWRRVTLLTFPFSSYPRHVQNLFNYAYRLLIIQEAFAVTNASAIVILDNGVEIRRPFAFSPIKRSLIRAGYWFTEHSIGSIGNSATSSVAKQSMEWTLNKLGASPILMSSVPLCASGLTAFSRSSIAYVEIVLPAIDCALHEECIAPDGAGTDTHNFDHSVLSALIHQTGRYCESNRAYHEWDMSYLTETETNYNQVAFAWRRGHAPKPYIRHIQQHINAQCSFIPPLKRALIENPAVEKSASEFIRIQKNITAISQPSGNNVHHDHNSDESSTSSSSSDLKAQLNDIIVQGMEGFPMDASHPVVVCLKQNFNQRFPCREPIEKHERLLMHRDAKGLIMPSSSLMQEDQFIVVLRRMRASGNWISALLINIWIWSVFYQWKHIKGSNMLLSLLILLPVTVAIFFPFYMISLNDHGTFSPLVVWWSTHLHHISKTSLIYAPSTPSISNMHKLSSSAAKTSVSDADFSVLPPAAFHPPTSSVRVVFTLSTLPHQLEFINETLNSLAAQELIPAAIYLNLPEMNRRTGQLYTPPTYLTQGQWMGVPLIINRGEDIGPLTKLAPTLLVENDPLTIIITCDSDKVYPKTLSKALVWFSEHDPTTVYGVCGWSFLWRPPPVGVLPIYVPWLQRGYYGRRVDVLQACCGNAYRRGMFPLTHSSEMQRFMSPHPSCFTTDDLWIAGWLATMTDTQHPIPLVLIPGGHSMWDTNSPEPSTAQWKRHLNSHSDGLGSSWDLSSINTAAGIDMACIRGVEQTLGPWREKRKFIE